MSDELLPILTTISTSVGKIDGKLDGIKEAFDAHAAQDLLVHTEAFRRIGALELAHASAAGKAAAVTKIAGGLGAASGVVGTLLVKFWPWHH